MGQKFNYPTEPMNAFRFGAVLAWVISTQLTRGADPLATWTWRNPVPSSSYLYGVAYGNGRFVAVGDTGTIMTSADDGVTWVWRESGTTNFLRGVTYGGGQFAAFGWGYTAINARGEVSLADTFTVILTSADGMNWVQRWSGNQTELHGIAYGNGQFVAVGIGKFTIVTSADGMNWIQRESVQRSAVPLPRPAS